jgi:hypothetical protein
VIKDSWQMWKWWYPLEHIPAPFFLAVLFFAYACFSQRTFLFYTVLKVSIFLFSIERKKIIYAAVS